MTRRAGESRAQNGGGQSTPPLGASDPSYLKAKGDDRLPADEQRGQAGADQSTTQPLGDARGPHETARAQAHDEDECVLTTQIGIIDRHSGQRKYIGPGRVTLPRTEIARLKALTHRVVADA